MGSRVFSPQDRALADAVVASRSGASAAVTDAHPDGWSRRTTGASSHFSGSTIATLNSVFVSDETAVHLDDVSAMLDELAATGLPYSFQTRGELPGHLRPLASSHGLGLGAVLPLMVLGHQDLRPAPVPLGVEIRPVPAAEAEPHVRLASLGLEIPISDLRTFLTPGLLDSDRWTTYLATVDGEPAGTAAALVSGDHVGLMSIVTDPAHRGRGIAAAITTLAVQRAFEQGIVRAFLQSSIAGYQVYERLGFREVEQWHIWVA